MSYSWSRYWKPVWFRDGDNYQKAHIEAWTSQRALYMICERLTNGLVFSPTRKSLTRVAQGMIHEMEPRVPLLHTTPKKVWTAGRPCRRMQHSGPSHQRCRRDALQPPEVPQPQYARDTCFIILKVVFDVHRGNQGSCWVPPPPRRPPGNRSTATSNDSLTKSDVVCVQETHGKDGFLQTPQVLRTQFRMFGTFMPDNAHAGGSGMFIRKNLLPGRAAVTHEVTYQCRDHIIKVQSGESLLVIINVHFDPGPSLRSLRERLRRLCTHWPRYPQSFGVLNGDFNVCEPEEGRFNVTNQTFAKGDAGKTALFRTFFPFALEIAQPNFTRKDAAADGAIRTLSRIDRAFINVPMAEARDFRCHFHVTDNLGERSIPSDHVGIRITFWKRQDHCGTSLQVPPWMSKHPLFCTILKQISDDHRYLDEPFAAQADFKQIIEKARH